MKTIDELTATEPPDGTVLVAQCADDWRIYIRDDANAREWRGGVPLGHRWFDAYDPGAGPNTLAWWLQDAAAVHKLGGKIAARKATK